MSTGTVIRRLGKLPAGLRGVNSLAALLLAGAAGGCLIHPPSPVRHVPPGEWLATLGGAERSPFRAELAPERPPVEEWQQGTERGLVAPAVVHGDLLILGSTGRVLTVSSAANGRRYWHRRFNGPVVGSPLRTGNTILLGTASRDGRIYAFTIERGRRLWHRRLHSPVTAEPVYHRGVLYAATLRGEAYALDARSGDVLWRTRIPGSAIGAPVLHEEALVIATSRDTLLRIQLGNGAIEAAAATPGTTTATPALAGQRLLVPVNPGVIAAFDAKTLAPLTVDTLDATVLAAPAVAEDGSAYVLTREGSVWRVTAAGAERIAALGGAARESLTLARNGLLVGRLDGTLALLRRDGTEVWRQTYGAAIRAPVTLGGGAAYLGLLDGKVIKLR